MLSGKKILLTAGGTGGHVNPALAVAGGIKEKYPDAEILFVGTDDRIEVDIVPAAGYDFKAIKMTGFERQLTWKNIKDNFKTVIYLLRSSPAVNKILDDFKPDVVVGFGGYVSGPVVKCAVKKGVPTAIHEQNAYPGITNKALAKIVDRVMLTYEKAKDGMTLKNETILTGLPVRGEILSADREISRAELGLDDKPLILSMGGSLGAVAINNAMLDLMIKLVPENKCNFIHATGHYGLWFADRLKENGIDAELNKNVEIREYISDMDRCMAAADLIICRSGASSLSEIQATGKASVLIPSPNVAENHQYHNAMALVNNNAATIIEENELGSDKLYTLVKNLLDDPERMKEMGENAKKMAILDSTQRIISVIESIVK